MIVFNNIGKKYLANTVIAVTDLNLTVNPGEFFCLVGPSGCGKSTVLKITAGLEQPSSGTVTKPEKVAMVFQSGALLPWLTVEENAQFGLKMTKNPLSPAKKFLEMLGLESLQNRLPRELSGGQRQRVGIARALAVSPEALLLDEPFSALDATTTEQLHQDLIKIWQETKITILMVSHSLEEAAKLADRVGVMKEGKIVEIVEASKNREEALKKLQKLL